MSGMSLLLLHRHFEAEDPIECDSCDGPFDLRFWAIEGEEMQCPECGELMLVEDVVSEQAEA